eukprot:ANDGO_06959.mRNA.1 hypothetical protein
MSSPTRNPSATPNAEGRHQILYDILSKVDLLLEEQRREREMLRDASSQRSARKRSPAASSRSQYRPDSGPAGKQLDFGTAVEGSNDSHGQLQQSSHSSASFAAPKGYVLIEEKELDEMLLRVVALEDRVKTYEVELRNERSESERALQEAQEAIVGSLKDQKKILEENKRLKEQLVESLNLNARLHELLDMAVKELQEKEKTAPPPASSPPSKLSPPPVPSRHDRRVGSPPPAPPQQKSKQAVIVPSGSSASQSSPPRRPTSPQRAEPQQRQVASQPEDPVMSQEDYERFVELQQKLAEQEKQRNAAMQQLEQLERLKEMLMFLGSVDADPQVLDALANGTLGPSASSGRGAQIQDVSDSHMTDGNANAIMMQSRHQQQSQEEDEYEEETANGNEEYDDEVGVQDEREEQLRSKLAELEALNSELQNLMQDERFLEALMQQQQQQQQGSDDQ